MNKDIRIRTRIDDTLLSKISKKLTLKKFASFDESKFIRAAIDNFIDQNLFNYISNINTICRISNEIKIDMNGLSANITQIIDHLKDAKDKELDITIENYILCRKFNIELVQEVEKLIKLLRPYEKNTIKPNIIMTRIDKEQNIIIEESLKIYESIKMDKSKFIRAAIKYFIDDKYYKLSNKQIEQARELNKSKIDMALIGDQINKVAFELNCGENVPKELIFDSVSELDEILKLLSKRVLTLYNESDKFN